MVKLIEIEPGKWRVHKDRGYEILRVRSDLPLPYVISDTMEPTEQVDGRFYTSKRAYRAVGRALGLTEVGTEKFKPKDRATQAKQVKQERRTAVKTAIEKYKAGQRPATRD
jgi:hypothetical protein